MIATLAFLFLMPFIDLLAFTSAFADLLALAKAFLLLSDPKFLLLDLEVLAFGPGLVLSKAFLALARS